MQINEELLEKVNDMDLRTLKLQLIRRILQTDDAQLLQTAAQLLEMDREEAPDTLSSPGSTPFPPPAGDTPLDEDARELQDSIDEVFRQEEKK